MLLALHRPSPWSGQLFILIYMGKFFLLQNLVFQAILSINFFGLHFLALALTFTMDLMKSLRSPLPPVGRLGAKSAYLRPPGPFHFGLGPGSNLLPLVYDRYKYRPIISADKLQIILSADSRYNFCISAHLQILLNLQIYYMICRQVLISADITIFICSLLWHVIILNVWIYVAYLQILTISADKMGIGR